MKPLLILTLLIAPLVVAFGDPASDKFDLSFPKKDHLTALQLYQVGYPAKAIDKTIGQFVLLDVVVTIERDVPVVEIVIPKELASDSARPVRVIQAHLISATTEASSRKKGERLRIEGIIVAEGYGAYTIYLHRARLIK
ncbi:MAG: hypothetical protein EXR31_06615 [Betaproteobacteria bacterium]|nr:hypothetical protein [Betaproteobacteria bacterium]